jgi:hypothetical protein
MYQRWQKDLFSETDKRSRTFAYVSQADDVSALEKTCFRKQIREAEPSHMFRRRIAVSRSSESTSDHVFQSENHL